MSTKLYLVLSGTIFGIVALLHLLRLMLGWSAVFDGWAVPMWISWCGLLGASALSCFAFRLASRQK